MVIFTLVRNVDNIAASSSCYALKLESHNVSNPLGQPKFLHQTLKLVPNSVQLPRCTLPRQHQHRLCRPRTAPLEVFNQRNRNQLSTNCSTAIKTFFFFSSPGRFWSHSTARLDRFHRATKSSSWLFNSISCERASSKLLPSSHPLRRAGEPSMSNRIKGSPIRKDYNETIIILCKHSSYKLHHQPHTYCLLRRFGRRPWQHHLHFFALSSRWIFYDCDKKLLLLLGEERKREPENPKPLIYFLVLRVEKKKQKSSQNAFLVINLQANELYCCCHKGFSLISYNFSCCTLGITPFPALPRRNFLMRWMSSLPRKTAKSPQQSS